MAKVGYGIDEGWATAAELARRHGLPRSSSVVALVARWNRAVTADRNAVVALSSSLGHDCPEIASVLRIDSRVRIVDGRRCRTFRAAHIALAVARNWKPSERLPWSEWASSSVRAHVGTALPDEVFAELVQTIILEARGQAGENLESLSVRLQAIVHQWCDGPSSSIEARLDARYLAATAGSLRGEALRQWCKISSERAQPTNREALIMLALLRAPRGGAFAASGLGRSLARHVIMDLARRSPTRLRDWRAFLTELLGMTACGDERGEPAPTEDWERVLVLLGYLDDAVRRSTHIVRELGVAAIVDAVTECISSTTDTQCAALLRAVPGASRIDRVVHHALLPVFGRSSRSPMLARRLTALGNWALRAGRELLLYAIVTCSGNPLCSDRWIGAVAIRAWRDEGAPGWLIRAVRDRVVRGHAPSAEKAVLRLIDRPGRKTSSAWAVLATPLARAVLAAALVPEPRERTWRDPTSLQGDWRADVAVLREALRRRRAPTGPSGIPPAIALCIELANESAGDATSHACHAAMRVVALLFRVADEATCLDVMTELARWPALDPHARELVATLGRLAEPATAVRAGLLELGERAEQEGRGNMVHWITRAFFLLADRPQVPAAWAETAVRNARQLGHGEAYWLLASGLADPRLGTDWAVALLREDPTLIEDGLPWVRRQLAELSTQIPGFNRLLSEASAARELTKRREQRKLREQRERQ